MDFQSSWQAIKSLSDGFQPHGDVPCTCLVSAQILALFTVLIPEHGMTSPDYPLAPLISKSFLAIPPGAMQGQWEGGHWQRNEKAKRPIREIQDNGKEICFL